MSAFIKRYKVLISGMADFAHLSNIISCLQMFNIVKSALYKTH